MPAVAAIHRLARRNAMPWLPELHTPEEDVAFFGAQVPMLCRVVLAEEGGPVGFVAYRRGWVDHLYVHPDHQRRGAGTLLLREAQAAYRELRLWTFQRNAAARAFYAARGFVEERRTDGSGNEEREPDVLLQWRNPPRTL